MKKVLIQLSGGLGNQLFQYSLARSFANKTNSHLVIDDWSGFINDKQFKRIFELGNYQIAGRTAKSYEKIPFWIHRIYCRIKKSTYKLSTKYFFGELIMQTEFKYFSYLKENFFNRSVWLMGTWQSHKYFDDIENTLREELKPIKPKNPKLIKLGSEMKGSNSVAVGVRLYEECKDSSLQHRGGKAKSSKDFNQVIAKLRADNPDAKFFIFSTHYSSFLKELSLPKDTKFLIGEKEYSNAHDVLWLLSQCKNHVISNSSFYWWGAWLSGSNWEIKEQEIYAANNFLNIDCYPSNWKSF